MDDCLIVGGGVIGLAAAYELSCHGMKVQLVERGQVGSEASWAGAGILPAPRRSPGGTPYEQLSALSRRLHLEWAERLRAETGIDNELSVCGEIHVACSPAAVAQLDAEAARWRDGDLAVESLSAADVLRLEPALALSATTQCGHSASPPILAACRLPEAGQLRNPRHLRALLAGCGQRGVKITTYAPVQELVGRDGRIDEVVTPAGTFRARWVVLCAGAWTADLLERLACPAPLKPIRGQIALLRLGAPLFRSVFHEGPHYLVPRKDGRVLVGSTLEDVGFDPRTTAEAIAELLSFAGSLVPGLAAAEVERCWAGLRPGSLLPVPLIGHVRGWQNVLVAAGHFRWGLFLSTGTAVLLRQLICGHTPEIDIAPFQPR